MGKQHGTKVQLGGKKDKVGRSLTNSRKKGRRHVNFVSDTHSVAGQENKDRLISLTETSDLGEFLMNAELAGREFIGERNNIQVLNESGESITSIDKTRQRALQDQNAKYLSVPRRPEWNAATTKDQLDANERKMFLDWRRNLAQIEENQLLHLTPFEKNLNVWRQLWRVLERSDVVVQIVDARNPLLYFTADLFKYVKEINPEKKVLLLLNKADYLPEAFRLKWAKYLEARGIPFAFWSANAALEIIQEEFDAEEARILAVATAKIEDQREKDLQGESGIQLESVPVEEVLEEDLPTAKSLIKNGRKAHKRGNKGSKGHSNAVRQNHVADVNNQHKAEEEAIAKAHFGDDVEAFLRETNKGSAAARKKESKKMKDEAAAGAPGLEQDLIVLPPVADDLSLSPSQAYEVDTSPTVLVKKNPAHVLTVQELKAYFNEVCGEPIDGSHSEGRVTIGMVGYPNVGKSSTLNAIFGGKKVAVSATPGKTKHFQTMALDKRLMICDCPGLVFPSFTSTKGDLVCNGVLPIDQLRDHRPATALICKRIPKMLLERFYGILIPEPTIEVHSVYGTTTHALGNLVEDDGKDGLRDADDAATLEASHRTLQEKLLPCTNPKAKANPLLFMQTLAAERGFMVHGGVPDTSRMARYVLKDYITGRLLYVHAPPKPRRTVRRAPVARPVAAAAPPQPTKPRSVLDI